MRTLSPRGEEEHGWVPLNDDADGIAPGVGRISVGVCVVELAPFRN